MKQVKIAEFKSHLSSHLRAVQKGEEVTILDRSQPIARVIPFHETSRKLVVYPPRIKGGLKGLKWPRLNIKTDVVALLREDRDRR